MTLSSGVFGIASVLWPNPMTPVNLFGSSLRRDAFRKGQHSSLVCLPYQFVAALNRGG